MSSEGSDLIGSMVGLNDKMKDRRREEDEVNRTQQKSEMVGKKQKRSEG